MMDWYLVKGVWDRWELGVTVHTYIGCQIHRVSDRIGVDL